VVSRQLERLATRDSTEAPGFLLRPSRLGCGHATTEIMEGGGTFGGWCQETRYRGGAGRNIEQIKKGVARCALGLEVVEGSEQYATRRPKNTRVAEILEVEGARWVSLVHHDASGERSVARGDEQELAGY
jgi:hypothetical protein